MMKYIYQEHIMMKIGMLTMELQKLLGKVMLCLLIMEEVEHVGDL